MIDEKKILRIEDMCRNEVYLGWESVSEVWSLETVVSYRLSYSSASNFKHFYDDMIRAVAEMSGDANTNIYNIVNRLLEKSDDVCCMLEVLHCMPEKALFNVQPERRIQEKEIQFIKKKMWMLYAEHHWTKAIDLKSAVERLYEKLGALEFDADHKAIYVMEKYYKAQQCEKLWDQYKIGRKCLVKLMSEIGLHYFLNTINKYISNSDTSDEEEYKAVEQNCEGSETTKIEESKKIKVDSIPTSCIQLAKEQIIKYSDPKYNINDLKTGDCETMLLNQTIYYLNKSKSKWISVGLYYPFEFASVVKIFGRSKQYVIFKEEEWIQFHEQLENINKYFQTFDTMWKPRQIGSKTLTFEMIEEKKILKIEDMSGNEVYLGWESVSEVWSLESVLRYRLSYSSGSNFKYFYEDVIRAVAEMSGDVKINIYNIINRLSEKSDDVCCMLEVLLFMPEKALFDVQLERRIQEQGQKRVKKHLLKKIGMLYAQEHWTKSYDLKSAVERLYEELGALEFDADHEAIYGMERYYTIQQCEELRDKYKIGRKVCRKFLQGKTCSQCLVKRISEIGLRHFLDTVNKYIKDCSDSSSSSDKEVFKAVEQNGEETT
ncbi:hypothetical protein FQA39_LY17808 [Lamprigera yunnana]|nr:hypothetical protein FQA39_LY17808 [Lamprigera yunnana]